MIFDFQELGLKDAYIIRGFHSGDRRGGFTKSFEKGIFKEAGIELSVYETFASSSMKNVIRGLHFQDSVPQAKLVSVISGSVWDVIVDLRPESPTFRQWKGYELSSENHLSIYVPRGFAHGFVSFEDNTVMLYQCDGKYDKENDTGIVYNDPDIGICWPLDEDKVICSERDRGLQSFREYMAHRNK